MKNNAGVIFLLTILLSVFVFPFASAITYISFSPLGLDAEDLHIYNATGVLVGTYNTTSAGVPFIDNQSYTILVVPSDENLMGNHPDLWFEMFINKLKENSTALFVVFFCLALVIAAARRR